MVRLLRRGALAAVLALTAGCAGEPSAAGGDASAAPVVLREATLRPGQPLPSPAGTTLLAVTGRVTVTNVGDTLALDRRTLAQLGLVQVHVYEPWVKRDMDFRGVWLRDVLTLAGVTGPAAVRITALDDYTVDLSAAALVAGGILLATGDGTGAEIPVDAGGPTRIVFTDGVEAGANADQWIWSLRTIDVR